MRTLLLAVTAALALASAAAAGPSTIIRGPPLRHPICLTVMCGGKCLPRGVTCHKVPPTCRAGFWPCGQTCIKKGQACRR